MRLSFVNYLHFFLVKQLIGISGYIHYYYYFSFSWRVFVGRSVYVLRFYVEPALCSGNYCPISHESILFDWELLFYIFYIGKNLLYSRHLLCFVLQMAVIGIIVFTQKTLDWKIGRKLNLKNEMFRLLVWLEISLSS